jgi:hypothetical protein
MKPFIFLLCVMSSFGAYSQTDTPEQQLSKLEDTRLKAIVDKDSVALSSLYDAAYRGILTSGREVNKAQVTKFQLSGNAFVKISIENVKPTLHGNVGITTGTQVNRSKAGTILGQSKFMRVYLKKENGWKIIYSQGTLIAGEEM